MKKIINQSIIEDNNHNDSIKEYLYGIVDNSKIYDSLSKSEIKLIVSDLLEIIDFHGE